MKTLIALFATIVALAPTAYADPSTASSGDQVYQAYLAEIAANGVVVGRPKKVIELGKIVCYNVQHGISVDAVIRAHFGSYGPGVAMVITNAAQNHLCPDTLVGQPEP